MVFRKSEKRIKDKGKPQSKPLPPRNFEKHRSKVVSSHGSEVGTSRRDLEEEKEVLPIKETTPIKEVEKEMIIESQDKIENEIKETEETKVIVDRIDFMNGDHKLSIVFSKGKNRLFRLQVYLDDKTEIRPVTYTGATTGYAFWNMIKNILMK